MLKKTIIIISVAFAIFFSFSFLVDKPVAAACDCDTATNMCNADCVQALEGLPCQTKWDCATVSNSNCSLCTMIEFVVNVMIVWIFGLGILAALVFLVIGGIRYITAGDDEKKIGDAKGTIKWALVGFIIVILAAAVIRLVWYFFGFEQDKIFVIPTDDPTIIDCRSCQ